MRVLDMTGLLKYTVVIISNTGEIIRSNQSTVNVLQGENPHGVDGDDDDYD